MYHDAVTVPSDLKIAAWANLLRAHRVALGHVEQALKAENLPPLSWYDALLELRRASGGLRAAEMESRMLLAQYSVSRLIERLEKAGMVARVPDPEDGRARVVKITASGKRMLRTMWPVYSDAIQTAFADRIGDDDARRLKAILAKIN